ncbi:MAG: phosphoglycerate dehydrogenase [bacterium]|jgi:D-3-phosphoglycerate dehydrogenase
MKVIVTEPIAEAGIECLRREADVDLRYGINRDELLACLKDYDAMIIRSAVQVDEELLAHAPRLKAVGRAGNGVDNIDIESATRHGVVVVNSPEANSISAAEHTIGLLLASCRNIPQANAFLQAGKWGRKQFEGVELYNKTVGIIGLGRIGSLVAARLQAFGMRIVAYDPYITAERFDKCGAVRMATLADLLREADFITVHTPKTEETYGMIGEEELKLAKPGVRVVNCARGGIYNERALYEALRARKVASAGLDVFDEEPSYNNPLFGLPNVVSTSHLGATTVEAQNNVGISVAQSVLGVLRGELVAGAVNLPSLPTQELSSLRPYVDLAEKLGKLYYQLHSDLVREVKIDCGGDLAELETRMVTVAFLKGLLETVLKDRVNYVNAPFLASNRGIRVVESKGKVAGDYQNLLRFTITGERESVVFAGTVFGREEQKIVAIHGYKVDVSPSKYMLFVENIDQPGMIGTVGTTLGQCNVNIATMHVGRLRGASKALMILNVDNPVGAGEIARIRRVDGIVGARFVRL